ncbi:MAG: hypothetical protein IPP34_09215 [Bacteroidetes bacterium]|nr:hypothetical protein [Bacteroidota bacterium]
MKKLLLAVFLLTAAFTTVNAQLYHAILTKWLKRQITGSGLRAKRWHNCNNKHCNSTAGNQKTSGTIVLPIPVVFQ